MLNLRNINRAQMRQEKRENAIQAMEGKTNPFANTAIGQAVRSSPVFQRYIRNTGMQTRPPVIANKARGTMSSGVYKSMSGML